MYNALEYYKQKIVTLYTYISSTAFCKETHECRAGLSNRQYRHVPRAPSKRGAPKKQTKKKEREREKKNQQAKKT